MNGKKIMTLWLCVMLALPMIGCAGGQDYGQYAQAVKEQNITRQLRIETARREKEYDQRKHEEKMAMLTGNLVIAASKTASPNDDMMVPLVMMMMEDKWSMGKLAAQANAPQENMATIEPPETTGEVIRASTGAVLGLGAIALAGWQSKQLADVATAGLASAGTHNVVSGSGNSVTNDSYKSGTDNYVDGTANQINGGDVGTCADCAEGEEGLEEQPATCEGDGFQKEEGGSWWLTDSCSCDSRAAGNC